MGNAAEPAPQRGGGAGDANADDREVHWRDVATKREQDLTEVREFVPRCARGAAPETPAPIHQLFPLEHSAPFHQGKTKKTPAGAKRTRARWGGAGTPDAPPPPRGVPPPRATERPRIRKRSDARPAAGWVGRTHVRRALGDGMGHARAPQRGAALPSFFFFCGARLFARHSRGSAASGGRAGRRATPLAASRRPMPSHRSIADATGLDPPHPPTPHTPPLSPSPSLPCFAQQRRRIRVGRRV